MRRRLRTKEKKNRIYQNVRTKSTNQISVAGDRAVDSWTHLENGTQQKRYIPSYRLSCATLLPFQDVKLKRVASMLVCADVCFFFLFFCCCSPSNWFRASFQQCNWFQFLWIFLRPIFHNARVTLSRRNVMRSSSVFCLGHIRHIQYRASKLVHSSCSFFTPSGCA